MKYLNGLLLILFFFGLQPKMVTSQSWVIEYIGTYEGLASPDIWTLYQDNRNIIWAGTNTGISAFDGKSFLNYSHTDGGIRIGKVKTIAEDQQNRLWLGSDQGLFYWQYGQFHGSASLGLNINVIYFSEDGTLWLGCENGMYTLHAQQLYAFMQGDSVNAMPLPDPEKVLDIDNRITDIQGKADGSLLISTYYFICQYDGQNLKRIWGQPNIKPNIRSIELGDNEVFYWACENTHFYRYQQGDISIIDQKISLATDLYQAEEDLWLLTMDSFYYMTEGRWQQILTENDKQVWNRKLLMDREGNAWIGSSEGLIKIKRSPFQQYDSPPFAKIDQVYAIGEDKAGRLLVGGNRGELWLKEGQIFIPFLPKGQSVVSNAEVFSIYTDQSSSLWLGTGYQGIAQYTYPGLQNFTSRQGLADNSRYFFFENKKGELWTGGDGGVDRIIIPAKDTAKISFQNFSFELNDHAYVSFFTAIESPDEQLWFGGTHGLFSLRDSQIRSESIVNFPISSLYITDIIEDIHQNLWISTMGEGILQCSFDAQNQLKLIRQISTEDGLPTNAFLCIIADKKGNVWAGTYEGICKLKVDQRDSLWLRFFDKEDGFPGNNFTEMVLFEDRAGKIWGGTSEGLFSFHPNELKQNLLPPKVLITEVKLMEGKEDWEMYSSASYSFFGLPSEPILPHYMNILRFQFTGLSMKKPSDIRFRYRLDGLESNWNYTKTERSATYHLLAPGEYQFVLQAANEDGIFSEDTAIFEFEIKSAFWHSSWFRLVILITVAFIGIKIRQYYNNKRELKEAIVQQERELAHVQKEIAETKLKALQAQMNPHFIFNSLNSINWYIVKEHPQKATQYLSKFSKLVRTILNHSQKLRIPLSSELAALELYLELEFMRFEDRFTYTIDADPAIDLEEVFIPPMILQPFVENAIWHGLMHKVEKGEILIQLFPAETHITCIIQDDGIGREAAAKRQSIFPNHQSKGIQLTSDRINLLHNDYLEDHSIRIIDLKDNNSQATGTRIEILLPYE